MKHTTFRMTHFSANLVIVILFAILIAIIVFPKVAESPMNMNNWIIIGIFLMASLIALWWGNNTYLEVKDGVLTSNSVMSGKKSIQVREIDRAYISISYGNPSTRLVAFKIVPKKRSKVKAFYTVINLTDIKNLRKLIHAIPVRTREINGKPVRRIGDLLK